MTEEATRARIPFRSLLPKWAGRGGFALPQAAPIVPPQAIAGRALTLVIAIMTFLASLTLGAVTLTEEAARAWLADMSGEITIEVRPLEGVPLAEEIAEAVELASGFPGVGAVHALSDEETRRLLEPWLGAGADLSALPVPRLIRVAISDPARFDAAALAAMVARTIRGGSIDDHHIWTDRLAVTARVLTAAGLIVLGLVLIAMVLSVVFATRAAMAGNKHIIEVLHFCGAEDRFIAEAFQRHFLGLGARGGFIGGGLALFLFALLRLAPLIGLDAWDESGALLLGAFEIGPQGYAGVALLIAAVALITAITSRIAVHRALAALE